MGEAIVIIFLLEGATHVTMHRSKKSIQLLQEKLSRTTRSLSSPENRKILRISIASYCLFMVALNTLMILVCPFSKLRRDGYNELLLRLSTVSSKEMVYFLQIMVHSSFVMLVLNLHVLYFSVFGYYFFVCFSMKQCLSGFVSKSRISIKQQDYETVLKLYGEMREVIILADSFLSFPAFIFVLIGMIGVFWYGCVIAFFPCGDLATSVFVFTGILHYSLMLLMVILPSAAVNDAAELALEVVVSLPDWFPQCYQELKIKIRREFKSQVALTLWKIFKVKKPLLLNVVGILITYGFLLGAVGDFRVANEAKIASFSNYSKRYIE
ncbi:uncharacterized protein CDAR_593911 [Caerostris darwini]|uniref:Gustatory receptor n=1 Tax=Caerostris darwini TaxID=1538125 RepID=A0AAV4RQX4_9ARAC|nr:uncharacterized protein CDAR_593911 [Caerostris darwini]